MGLWLDAVSVPHKFGVLMHRLPSLQYKPFRGDALSDTWYRVLYSRVTASNYRTCAKRQPGAPLLDLACCVHARQCRCIAWPCVFSSIAQRLCRVRPIRLLAFGATTRISHSSSQLLFVFYLLVLHDSSGAYFCPLTCCCVSYNIVYLYFVQYTAFEPDVTLTNFPVHEQCAADLRATRPSLRVGVQQQYVFCFVFLTILRSPTLAL